MAASSSLRSSDAAATKPISTALPTGRLEQSQEEECLFQEGEGDWQVLKDNQLWEKEDTPMVPSKQILAETNKVAENVSATVKTDKYFQIFDS